MSEKYFQCDDLPTIDMPAISARAGIYAVGVQPDTPVGDQIGSMPDGSLIEWLPGGLVAESMQQAIEIRQQPHSVTVAGSEQTSDYVRLAIAFSDHVTKHREQKGNPIDSSIIVTQQPTVPNNYVRLPHLVAVNSNERVDDVVIWEALKEPEAERWLGAPLPDQTYFEERLAQIITLKQAWRSRQSSHHVLESILQEKLDQGRYMSILFVYQHAGLFMRLLDSME